MAHAPRRFNGLPGLVNVLVEIDYRAVFVENAGDIA
jgi:hypothetical protein